MKNTKKYVPMEKRSKKEQRAYNAQQRVTFESMGCLNPVSRVIPSKGKNAFNRNKRSSMKAELRSAY